MDSFDFLQSFVAAFAVACLATRVIWIACRHAVKKEELQPEEPAKSIDALPAVSTLTGRFKYTALRSDLYALKSPPKYSLVDLDLPLPPLEPGEQEALDILKQSVADLREEGKRADSCTLLRFLRARKGDTEAAEAYFRFSWQLRDELQIPLFETHWNLEAYERTFAPWYIRGGIIGHSFEGGIIGYERFGHNRFPELLKVLPWEVLRRLDAAHMVRVLAAFEEDSMRTGKHFMNAILVLDLLGWDMSWCKPHIVRAYGKVVEQRDALMPCTLKHVLVIRAPRAFSLAWDSCKYLLHPDTRNKVQIVSGDGASLATLRKYMSDDVIPAFIGGKAHTQGDPECQLFLGSCATGPVPSQAVRTLLERVAEPMGSESGTVDQKEFAEPEHQSSCLGRGCFVPFGPCVNRRKLRSNSKNQVQSMPKIHQVCVTGGA